ncbi:polysaccharide deacetylase family protein [Marixanthomonas spongiae]|uniref:Polysaccharide deacetylase family protein n=1 Tax=Marixanthomonas spongiae TaxID=2174845 RepID=A0A2U0HZQ4_9FLAO|nr:polysaccharide deacetylase family protein [Marixanthomonas spongiae]PVW14317.1 polysaccharide deacetylase family protein [Marixanthomonas spongiae]
MLKFGQITVLAAVALLIIGVVDFFSEISPVLYIALLLLWLLIVALGSFTLRWGFFTTFITKGNQTEKQVAITFDDGPHPEYTLEILKLLKSYNAKATFFCIGKNLEKYPKIAQQLIADGHSLGNHSYSHATNFGFFRKKRIVEELAKTDVLLEKITGSKNVWFRPPYGVTNPSIAKAVKETNHNVVGWNVRSYDTVIKNPTKVVNRIKKRVSPNAIILLHDTHSRCPEIVERLLQFLKKEGYQTVTVERLLKKN